MIQRYHDDQPETVIGGVGDKLRGAAQRVFRFVIDIRMLAAAGALAVAVWGGGSGEDRRLAQEELIKIFAEKMIEELAREQAAHQDPLTGEAMNTPPPPLGLAQTQSASESAVIIADQAARIADLEQENEYLDAEADNLTGQIEGLRRALAQARINTDSAANQAAIEAASEVRESYEDQVCFTRPEWDSYRSELVGLCNSPGSR